MSYFGCCRRPDASKGNMVDKSTSVSRGLSRPLDPIITARTPYMSPDLERDPLKGSVDPLAPEPRTPSRKAALVTWCVSLVYAAIAMIIAVVAYNHVGPSGEMGTRAMSVVQHIAGNHAIRDWSGSEAAKTAMYLKGQISKIEFEFPNRVEAMHQTVPINEGNIGGPASVAECRAIMETDCIHQRGGCARCPFRESAPEGPRCCGQPTSDGKSPLPVFSRTTEQLGAPLDLRDDGGSVQFSNVVFRVKGSGEPTDGSAILVSAHYDSASYRDTEFEHGQDPGLASNHGPGVSDDLAGVANILEVARKLAAEPPLPRDVIFALVTGEEAGLMGGVLFKQLHEWRARPAVAINLEGKGKASSKEWLVRATTPYAAEAYAKFAPRPAGFSIAEWIAVNLNVGITDLSIYRRLGVHGMELVYVHDSYVYHTPDDSVESASPEGLEHESQNLLSILRGTAQDPNFPKRLTPEDDPVVGYWSNDIQYDPGLTSNCVYLALFDYSMWIMSVSAAKALFDLTALLSIIAVVITLRIFWYRAKPPTAPPLTRVLAVGALELLFGLACLGVGAITGICMELAVISNRDARTWFVFPLTRIAFLALSGTLPMLLLDVMRRRPSWAPKGLLANFVVADESTEHSMLFGMLGVNAFLLLSSGLALPDLGFAMFWFVLLAPCGLIVEASLQIHLPAIFMIENGSGFSPLSSSELPFLQNFPGAGAHATIDLIAALSRDVFAVFMPTLLQVPQMFNLVSVLTYVIDSLRMGKTNGLICGICGVLFAMPFMPGMRRLPYVVNTIAVIVMALAWLVLLFCCIFVPTNTKLHCYFDFDC